MLLFGSENWNGKLKWFCSHHFSFSGIMIVIKIYDLDAILVKINKGESFPITFLLLKNQTWQNNLTDFFLYGTFPELISAIVTECILLCLSLSTFRDA